MRGGELDRRITIQQKSVVQDTDFGTQTITWATFAARIPAQVQDVLPSKSESAAQGIRMDVQPARVRIRYLPGVTSDMRILVHGTTDRTMQITAGPAELERRRWLEFMAEEFSTVANP